MSRFVFDTNVVISALLFNDSVPGRALSHARSHGTILVSGASLTELGRVLGGDRFNRYVTHTEHDEFLAALIRESEAIEITETVRICRDPDDDRILELAINGHATCIVTGDADLLALNPFRNVEIVTPTLFLESPG